MARRRQRDREASPTTTHLFDEDSHGLLEECVRDSAVVRIASSNNFDGHIYDRPDPDGRVFAVKLDCQQRFRADLFPLKRWGAKAFPVSSSNLAQNPHSRMRVLMVEWQRSEQLPQANHDVVNDRCHERIEKLLREVVDAQLERAQALTDEVGSGLKCVDKWTHEVGEVRQKNRKADRHGEDELGEKVASRFVGRL